MYSHLINPVFKWNRQRISDSQVDIILHQKVLLEKIIAKNSQTEYLKKLSILEETDFIKNCPAIGYDDLEPLILQIKDLNVNHLCSDKVVAFSKSSGTTSRSKFIPLTKQAIQANFTAGKSMLSYYIAENTRSKIFEGQNFSLTGTYSKIGNYIVGDVSALFTYFLSPWYRPFRVPKMQLATLADWNEKLDTIVPILAKSDIRWIAGVPSWMSIVIDKVEDYTQKPIHKLWHNLEVYFYGGVSIKPYESYFKEKFNGDLKLWQTYNASEGFFGLQTENYADGMSLLYHLDNYFEFIRYSDVNAQKPDIIGLNEIELGGVYELVITNLSGLYRYRMGDLLKIVNLNPLRFEIVGRTKNSINIFGEELMVNNTEQAIAELNKEMNFMIKDYTVAPVVEGNTGYHHWLIEFNTKPDDIAQFQWRLDQILRTLNSDYDAKRYNDIIMKPLTIEVLELNTIERWLDKNKRKTVQAKVPKLWEDDSIQRQLKDINHQP